jgi:hypothetical protein
MRFKFILALLLSSTCCLAQQLPNQNPNLSAEERAKDLILRLTLEEKALLMPDQSPAIPGLGIKRFNWWSEALHGLANNDSVTVFPEPVGLAASFDDSLVYKIFSAVSDETRANAMKQCGGAGEPALSQSFSVEAKHQHLQGSEHQASSEAFFMQEYFFIFYLVKSLINSK